MHEIGTLHLNCTDGGTIKAIAFASYGEVTGSCSGGFIPSPHCDQGGTTANVAAVCVGNEGCVVTASSQIFGDPCPRKVKSLAVVATGCRGVTTFGSPQTPNPTPAPTVPVFTHDVVVPLGATAAVSWKTCYSVYGANSWVANVLLCLFFTVFVDEKSFVWLHKLIHVCCRCIYR